MIAKEILEGCTERGQVLAVQITKRIENKRINPVSEENVHPEKFLSVRFRLSRCTVTIYMKKV